MVDTETKPWAVGDPCPSCAGELTAVPAASAEQYAAAAHRDSPTPMPVTVDSADPAQIAKLGDLYRCRHCGYQSRVPSTSKKKAGRNTSGD